MFKTKADRLESLIQYVYQELSKYSNKEIKILNKHNLVGKSGVTHNIDVYYQFEQNGIKHKVIFECKNWNSKVSKEKVLTLKSIIEDIPNSVGIMVAPQGYQKGAKEFAAHHGIQLISGSEESLLSVVIQKQLKVVLPDEKVIGEPFYCLMEKNNDGRVTGAYIQSSVIDDEPLLILCFSKKEAEEIKTNLSSVVRGIDKKHLEVLCNYSDNFGLKLAIKRFMSTEVLVVETQLIRDYFL
ncbi:restriction endonuclease [Bacillus pumilus]|uniref:restriction endonuclease n=1 Tax=Bacillus pumilus TaxID=1408 RepID=UPI0024173752|nr:restriction endonuclease [Bacillus pumilus]WFO48200.1 restriction endonuclease [Bacillus pumilus]